MPRIITEQLAPEAALALIADALWRMDDPPRFDPDKEWSPETLDAIADVMVRMGYHPDDMTPRKRAERFVADHPMHDVDVVTDTFTRATCSHWRTCHHAACLALR